MTERRVLCTWRALSGALLLTMGLMAMPVMADHPECAPGAGDCCTDTGSPGCDDPVCCHDVCTDDPFCCESMWDGICAGSAAGLCPKLCGGPPPQTDCADDGDTLLSQSTSTVIIAGSVACSGDGGTTTTHNAFARGFNNIPDDFTISCVLWAIEAVNVADNIVTFSIYEDTNGGAPTHPDSDLKLLGSAPVTLPADGGGTIYVANFGGPGPGGIPVTAGMDIVVEIEYQDTTGISGVWVGSNPNGQSAPSYIRSINCNLLNYGTLASIGFPDMMIITEVRGNLGGAVPPCPWDLDGSGSVGTNDLLLLFAVWGDEGVPADFDGGGVGTSDLLIMFANWGPCPE